MAPPRLLDIMTDYPERELWRQLRRFLDRSYVEAVLTEHHKPPRSQRANIAKQAAQVSYCIRQAQEYLEASAEVGLATRPNLAYYGAMSLATALALVRQTGTSSLDYLREHDLHQHHGLIQDSKGLASAWRSNDPSISLHALKSRLNLREDEPYGTFILFFRSLTTAECFAVAEAHILGSLETVNMPRTLPGVAIPREGLLSTCRFSTLELMQLLPDMYGELDQHGIRSVVYPGTLRYVMDSQIEPWEEPKLDTPVPTGRTLEWTIQTPDNETRHAFIDLYSRLSPQATLTKSLIPSPHFIVQWDDSRDLPYLPDIVQDVERRTYFVLDPDAYIPEAASYLAILFNLSILARYFPDVWLRAIDENLAVAGIVAAFLEKAIRKFPNLVLDQMTGILHCFHS